MKKLLFIVATSCLALACNSGAKPSGTDSTAAAPAADSAAAPAKDTSSASAPATLKDGLMTMKDGKMMIVKNNSWSAMDSTVTCTNGRKVTVDGTVSKGDKKRKLENGMMIDKDGQVTDKDGKPLDTTGWD